MIREQHPTQRPSLIDIYHEAQRLQYGAISPQEETPPAAALLEGHEATQVSPTQRVLTEFYKHPKRYIAAGIALIALAGFALQSRPNGPSPEAASDRANAIPILVGSTASVQEQIPPTGDPATLTFASLMGKRIEVGSLLMNSVGGSSQIIYTRSDNSTGTVALPTFTHQQNLEIYAQPLLLLSHPQSTGDYTPTIPLTVTPKDGTYSVNVDRSKIGVIVDYGMPGTYTAKTDATTKVATATLATKDTRDIVSIGFLPASPPPLSATAPGLTEVTINRVNSLAAATDDIATTVAKVISLKESTNYITSIVTNACFAQANDPQPANTTALIQERIDGAVKTSLEKWATDNHRTLYLNMVGSYPLTAADVLAQYAAQATVGKDSFAQATARDVETITNNQYAGYFGVSAVKIACVPDKTLKPAGQ